MFMLRNDETDRIPLAAKTVPVIVFRKGEVLQAQTINEKIVLLESCTKRDTVIAVWPGQWKSDTFIVDKAIALKKLKAY